MIRTIITATWAIDSGDPPIALSEIRGSGSALFIEPRIPHMLISVIRGGHFRETYSIGEDYE